MRTKAHKEMKSGNTESEIHIEHKRYYRRNSYQGTLILLSLKQYLDMQPEEFSKGQIIHTDEKSGCDIIMPAEVSWHRGKRIKFLKWAQILKFLYHSVGSCGRCDCKEGENNMTNFHTDRHYSHRWNNTIHIWSSRNQYFMYGSYPLQRIPHAFSNKQTCPIFNFSPMMSCIHSFNEKFLHLKIELQQCSPYSLCRDCDMLKNKSS